MSCVRYRECPLREIPLCIYIYITAKTLGLLQTTILCCPSCISVTKKCYPIVFLESSCIEELLHCKNIWVTSTIFWLSQLHACCVFENLSFQKAYCISDERLVCFFDPTHLPLEECLGSCGRNARSVNK